MKKIILSIIAIYFTTTAFAQQITENEVPDAVKQSFATQYPNTKAEKWEKEGADFEVEFHLNSIESSALFGSNGAFKEFEQQISIKALPKAAINYCLKNYKGYSLSEASKITDVDGIITYEVEMKSRAKKYFDVLFNNNGNFIKKTEVTTIITEKEETPTLLQTREPKAKLVLPNK